MAIRRNKWRASPPPMNDHNPVRAAQVAVCERLGVNLYGRVEQFVRYAEQGQDAEARRELLDLLQSFPKKGG